MLPEKLFRHCEVRDEAEHVFEWLTAGRLLHWMTRVFLVRFLSNATACSLDAAGLAIEGLD